MGLQVSYEQGYKVRDLVYEATNQGKMIEQCVIPKIRRQWETLIVSKRQLS